MPRCFFKDHAPADIKRCDGPVQQHHVIKEQTLRDHLGPERPHLLTDRELLAARRRQIDAMRDRRNLLPACKRHHRAFHTNRERFGITAADLPESVQGFADEHGLGWELDRQFGTREEAA